MARAIVAALAAASVAASYSAQSLRAEVDRRNAAAGYSYAPRTTACNTCTAANFAQLISCIGSSNNVCIQITRSFVITSTVTINTPGLWVLYTSGPGIVLSGSDKTQLFLVKNVDADLVIQNLDIVGGVSEFSGYQGGGGAVQITAGNLTMVGVVILESYSLQQSAQQDIGGGAINCMDQANTLALLGCGFGNNSCFGCSGGAIFSSCATYIENNVFVNNSIQTNDASVVSGNALRIAQINSSAALINTTIVASGVGPGAATVHAVSVSSTALNTFTLMNNVSVADNVGGGIRFVTDASLRPVYQFIVGNSTFVNNTAPADAGGAISVQINSGSGTTGIESSVFETNYAAVGGAASLINLNSTAAAPFYISGSSFLCNAAVATTVGNAVNNGDTKGGFEGNLYIATSNFIFAKGCPTQDVLGSCTGQCPT